MVQKWDLTFIQSFLGDSVEEDQSPFQVGLYEQRAKLGHQEWVQMGFVLK